MPAMRQYASLTAIKCKCGAHSQWVSAATSATAAAANAAANANAANAATADWRVAYQVRCQGRR